MSIALAGVFDSELEARAARTKLEKTGIDRQSIQIEPISSPVEESDDRRGFFAKLFGLGDDENTSRHYAEAVRRGNRVVTVHLPDEDRVEEVSAILEDAGAVDIDERVAQWKASGYEPPFITGKPISAGRGSQTMEAVEETLPTGKRGVPTGRVRVHRTTTDAPLGKPVSAESARAAEDVSVGSKSSQRDATVRDPVRSTIDVDNSEEIPQRAAALAALLRYSGPERRMNVGGSYQGTDRRARA